MKKIVMLIVFALVLVGCTFLKTPEIKGAVVDAETGKPIEGAVVLIEWTKTSGFGLTHTESYSVVEVLTDKDGKFNVPGVRAIFVNPHLTIYKKGFVAWNDEYIYPEHKKRRDFKWQEGFVFQMDKFKEGYSYDKHVSFIRSAINSTIGYEKKRIMRDAFDWETDLSREEIRLRK